MRPVSRTQALSAYPGGALGSAGGAGMLSTRSTQSCPRDAPSRCHCSPTEQTLPRRKGPFEKATAGRHLKMK